jgi:hypothetical protein
LVSPEDPKVSLVSFEGKNELTIPAQNLQGLQEKVSLVSKVSSVNQSNIRTPTPTQPPDQTPSLPFGNTEPEGTLDKTKEPSEEEEEEEVLLLMPERDSCPICEGKVWKFEKRVYDKKVGVGQCVKCGHISWFGDLSKGAVIDVLVGGEAAK